jgi:MFS family permease
MTADRPIPQARWWRIIPPAILVYIFSFMDRTSIGFAIAGGMQHDLHLSSTFAGFAGGIFFVGYVLLQVPGGHWAEHHSARKFIGLSILAWGGLTVLCGFVQNAWQLAAVRFLIGVAEGGVWPAIFVILTHWFPNEERGRANAYFIMNIAIASIITAPLSGWIISNWGWRYVFIGEGLLSLALILIWFPLIADTPAKAKWISPEERDYLTSRLAAEQRAITPEAPASYRAVLGNRTLWVLVLIYFFYQIGNYGFSIWLPSLVKNLTASDMTVVGFLSACPFIAMMVGLYFVGRLSDRSGKRRFYTAIPMLGFAVCFLLSALFEHNFALSFGFLVASGLFHQTSSSVFWTIPPIIFPAKVAGGARGIINALGNLGGFVGPFVMGWLRTALGNFESGIYFLVAMLIVGFLLTISLPSRLDNIRRQNT